MAQTLSINKGFYKMSDAELEVRTTQIIAQLGEYFATAPTLASLTSANTAFRAALAAAKEGGVIEKAIRDQKRTVVIEEHKLMIPYVEMTCAGDRPLAVKSGYSIAKAPSPSPEVIAPKNLILFNGLNSGEVFLQFDKVPGAKCYLYEYTADPLTEDSVWDNYTGTVRKHLFVNLEPGKRYWFRVAAIGINSQKVYSDPILSKIVQ